MKTRPDLPFFAAWQTRRCTRLQNQHSCAVRCRNARFSACCRSLDSASWEEFCLLLMWEARTAWCFLEYTDTRTVKLKGTRGSTGRGKKCHVATVICSLQPNNRLRQTCLKFDVFFPKKLQVHTLFWYSCCKLIIWLYCFWFLRPQHRFPFRGRKARPTLGKAA